MSRLSVPGEFCPKIVKELGETALKLLSIVPIELWQSSERPQDWKGSRLTPTQRGKQATELSGWKKWTIRVFVTISKNTKQWVTAEMDQSKSDLIQSKQPNFTWWKVVRLLSLLRLLSAEAGNICLTHPICKADLSLQTNVLIDKFFFTICGRQKGTQITSVQNYLIFCLENWRFSISCSK